MTGGQDNASCEVCWALVPRTMMHFHRAWHADHDGGGAVGSMTDVAVSILRG